MPLDPEQPRSWFPINEAKPIEFVSGLFFFFFSVQAPIYIISFERNVRLIFGDGLGEGWTRFEQVGSSFILEGEKVYDRSNLRVRIIILRWKLDQVAIWRWFSLDWNSDNGFIKWYFRKLSSAFINLVSNFYSHKNLNRFIFSCSFLEIFIEFKFKKKEQNYRNMIKRKFHNFRNKIEQRTMLKVLLPL